MTRCPYPGCPGVMAPGKALEPTSKPAPPADVVRSCNPDGVARLVPCLKCPECGTSLSA